MWQLRYPKGEVGVCLHTAHGKRLLKQGVAHGKRLSEQGDIQVSLP